MKNKTSAEDEFLYLSDFSNGILAKDPKRSISSPSNSLRLWKALEKNNQDTKSETQHEMGNEKCSHLALVKVVKH